MILNNSIASTGGAPQTWLLNSKITMDNGKSYSIFFHSNNERFYEIKSGLDTVQKIGYYGPVYNFNAGYNEYTQSWINEAYRTITLLEEPDENLLTWLQQNGVKQ